MLPGSSAVPMARNQRGPYRAIRARWASVSTFCTRVGAPPTPRSDTRGGTKAGTAGPPLSRLTSADSWPARNRGGASATVTGSAVQARGGPLRPAARPISWLTPGVHVQVGLAGPDRLGGQLQPVQHQVRRGPEQQRRPCGWRARFPRRWPRSPCGRGPGPRGPACGAPGTRRRRGRSGPPARRLDQQPGPPRYGRRAVPGEVGAQVFRAPRDQRQQAGQSGSSRRARPACRFGVTVSCDGSAHRWGHRHRETLGVWRVPCRPHRLVAARRVAGRADRRAATRAARGQLAGRAGQPPDDRGRDARRRRPMARSSSQPCCRSLLEPMLCANATGQHR